MCFLENIYIFSLAFILFFFGYSCKTVTSKMLITLKLMLVQKTHFYVLIDILLFEAKLL